MPRQRKKGDLYAPNRIKEWRERRGLSQDRLAELVGSNGQTIGRLENRKRGLSVEWLDDLARALQVRPADLLWDSSSVLEDHEHRLIDVYRHIPDREKQQIYRRIARCFAEPANEDV